MEAAYENAVRTIADAYEAERLEYGGRSLARVATIIVNNGAFFSRLYAGKPFSVPNLEKVAAWFRQPENWPDRAIPHVASEALKSIGRPPMSVASMPRSCGTMRGFVRPNGAASFGGNGS
jgi:hypothetical protein